MKLLNPIPLPYRILAVAALAAACGLTGYIHGRSFEKGSQARSQLHLEASIRKEERLIAQRSLEKAVERAKRDQRVRVVYQTVTKEVVRYAQSDAGKSACLDPEWVRFHNITAVPEAEWRYPGRTGTPASPEGIPDKR